MGKKICRAACAAAILMVVAATATADNVPGQAYTYDWASLEHYPVPGWFDDGKLGIFIHWGPYSVPGYRPRNRGYAEHFPQHMYRDPDKFNPLLEERFGATPPEFGYKDIIPLFRAEKWDPDAWADLFARAGARYVIPTGEHHDGFALWDSDLTAWCATKMGPRRDLIGDLAKAVRARGLKFGVSYHRERHYWFFAKTKKVAGPPHDAIAEEIRRVPAAADLYGPFQLDAAYMQDYVARWKEIQRKYRPDFMWLDDQPARGDELKRYQDDCLRMIVDYVNEARRWGKEVYFNNKGGSPNWPVDAGCREKDNLKLPSIGPKWQNPATLGTSYGYMRWEDENDAYKSPAELIHLLSDVVSKNGNLLLNVGPRADGTIPEGIERRLAAIGRWLEVNGEAIYGTRPWTTHAQAKPDLRFTVKGQTLYAIALERPSGPFVIESTEGWQKSDVEEVTLLGEPSSVAWEMTPEGIRIRPASDLGGEHAWVFKIRCTRQLERKEMENGQMVEMGSGLASRWRCDGPLLTIDVEGIE